MTDVGSWSSLSPDRTWTCFILFSCVGATGRPFINCQHHATNLLTHCPASSCRLLCRPFVNFRSIRAMVYVPVVAFSAFTHLVWDTDTQRERSQYSNNSTFPSRGHLHVAITQMQTAQSSTANLLSVCLRRKSEFLLHAVCDLGLRCQCHVDLVMRKRDKFH